MSSWSHRIEELTFRDGYHPCGSCSKKASHRASYEFQESGTVRVRILYFCVKCSEEWQRKPCFITTGKTLLQEAKP